MDTPGPSRPNQTKLVAEMTLEEAERKRASDRINQRYSRARKKSRVEELQKRNAELASRLAETEGRLQRLQHDFDALKGAVGAAHALSYSSENSFRDSPSEPSILGASPVTPSSNNYVSTNQLERDFVLDLPIEFGNGIVVNLLNDHGLDRSTSSGVVPEAAESMPWPASDHFIHDSTLTWAGGQNAAAHAALEIIEPFSELSQSALLPDSEQLPIWQSLPVHIIPPTTPIDHVLVNVSELGRRWSRQKGDNYKELSQEGFPSISSLLNPTTGDAALNPISTAVGKHATWGTVVIELPSRVAYHYIVAHMVRWLVCQSEETFNQLPEYLRPTKLQRTISHPAWIDVFPWQVLSPSKSNGR